MQIRKPPRYEITIANISDAIFIDAHTLPYTRDKVKAGLCSTMVVKQRVLLHLQRR